MCLLLICLPVLKGRLDESSAWSVALLNKSTVVECTTLFGDFPWAAGSGDVLGILEQLFDYIRLLTSMPRFKECPDVDLSIHSQLRGGISLSPKAVTIVGGEFAGKWRTMEESQFKNRMNEITGLASSVVWTQAAHVFMDLKAALASVFTHEAPYKSLNSADSSVIAAATAWQISNESHQK